MDRNAVIWTLVAFFGGSVLFGGLRRLTEDESTGTVVAVQVGALTLVIAVIVVIVRRRSSD
jgi:hypothetical protein